MAIKKNYPLTKQGARRWANDATKELNKKYQAAARRNLKPGPMPRPAGTGFNARPTGYPVGRTYVDNSTSFGDTHVHGDHNQLAVGTAGDVHQHGAPAGAGGPLDREALADQLHRVLDHLDDLAPGLSDDDAIGIEDAARGALRAATEDTEDTATDDQLRTRAARIRDTLLKVGIAAGGGSIAHGIAAGLGAVLG